MRGHYPPLDALLFFLVASRTESFTKAADVLLVTRSAVSRRIKNLEDHLGVTLFHRHQANLELTEAGITYADSLSQIFADLKIATDAVTSNAFSDYKLTLNVSATFTTTWLSPRLRKLEELHPNLALAFHTNSVDTGEEHVDFEGGKIDAAILLGNGNWPGKHVDKLLDIHVQPVCAPALLKDSQFLELEDLVNFNWLHYKHLPNLWLEWLTAAGKPDLKTNKRDIIFDNVALATQAAIDGIGIIPMYRPLADPKIQDGRLKAAHPHSYLKEEGYYFVCPKEYPDLPAINLFREWILNEVSDPTDVGSTDT